MHYGDEKRYNGRCKACGTVRSIFGVITRGADGNKDGVVTEAGDEFHFTRSEPTYLYVECECGSGFYAKPVLGKYAPEHVCDEKCMAATGHVCECSCGGANHGAAHS